MKLFLTIPCTVIEGGGEIKLVEIKKMVANVRGLKIEIYSKEHPPPHFHVKSTNVNASFSIKDCLLIEGQINRNDYNGVLMSQFI